jgi:hypothetical protein
LVVIAGIITIVAVFIVAPLHFKTPNDVTAATTATGGVIAALVGSYFGLRGATAAQGMAQQMMRHAASTSRRDTAGVEPTAKRSSGSGWGDEIAPPDDDSEPPQAGG